jgi:hypothetical protein
MLKLHSCAIRCRSGIRRFKLWAAMVIGSMLIAAEWILGVLAFGQQSQHEYIYIGGKIIASESSAFTVPTITLASPTSGSTYNTASNSITLAGAASDPSGISGLTWVNSRGGSGDCSGTTSWICSGLNLLAGQNVLTVTARDKQNSYVNTTLTVNYCTYTLSANSVNMAAGAGTGTVNNTCVGGCNWTATQNVSWITLAAGASGTGSGTVGYSVAANTGPARSGMITIAGQTFTINQASGCTYSLNPTSASYPVAGGTGSVAVTTASNCLRTATSNASWLTVTGNGSGTGNGIVNYSVAPNTIPVREGAMTIGNAIIYIHQASNPYCGDGICQEGSAAACSSDCSSCDQACVNNCMAGGLPGYACMTQCGCSQ